MRKLLYLMLVIVIAFGTIALTTAPVEAGKGGKGGGKPPKDDCSEQCPDVGPCVAVACGFDCVYECPFPF